MKSLLKTVLVGVFALALFGCGAYVNATLVKDLPANNYEKIIYLRTESPSALFKTLGVIYVLPGKNIKTSYPFKWELKSENELTAEQKLNFSSLKVVELKNKSGEIQGYLRVMGPVIVDVWQEEDGIDVELDMTATLGSHPEPNIAGQASGGGISNP
jgi:hypothetical protein